MAGRLRTHVHVRDEDGVNHVFGPSDVVPVWAADAIRNPKAWAGGRAPVLAADVAEVVDEGKVEPEHTPVPVPAPEPELAPVPEPEIEPVPVAEPEVLPEPEPVEPPRSGSGSGRDAWVRYAGELGYEVDPSSNRDDIIAAIDSERATRAPKE